MAVRIASGAPWVNRGQQRTIEYLVEEYRVLKEQLKGWRLRLTDDQRHRLAAKGTLLVAEALHHPVGVLIAVVVRHDVDSAVASFTVEELGRQVRLAHF